MARTWRQGLRAAADIAKTLASALKSAVEAYRAASEFYNKYTPFKPAATPEEIKSHITVRPGSLADKAGKAIESAKESLALSLKPTFLTQPPIPMQYPTLESATQPKPKEESKDIGGLNFQ